MKSVRRFLREYIFGFHPALESGRSILGTENGYGCSRIGSFDRGIGWRRKGWIA
jgi:hypothetical protein